ncbi:hypothetical protein [Phormidesmis sp. 146-33]
MIPREPPSETVETSAYRNHLHPWCIICFLPNMQRGVIARYRRRSHAKSHLSVLKRLSPTFTYQIVFDPPYPLENQETPHEQ